MWKQQNYYRTGTLTFWQNTKWLVNVPVGAAQSHRKGTDNSGKQQFLNPRLEGVTLVICAAIFPFFLIQSSQRCKELKKQRRKS
jgi:hypothetical protein